jgi:hypothetical protein
MRTMHTEHVPGRSAPPAAGQPPPATNGDAMSQRTRVVRGHWRWAAFAAVLAGALVALQGLAVVPAGATSGNVEVEVQAGGSYASDGRVAFDGTNRLVVWTVRTSEGRAVKAARVTADGSVGAAVTVSDSASNDRPRVAWNGSTYLVVWEHEYENGDIDVLGRKVSKAGVLAPGQFGVAVLTTHEREPAIVAAGATFYVAWTDDRNGGDDIYGSRISTAGNGSAVDDPAVRISNGVKPETKPELAWNGTRYLVTYELAFSATDPDVLTQVVSASNVPSPTVVTLAASGLPEEDPVVASNGSGFLVAWADGPQGTSDIKGYRLSGTGALAGPVVVSAATGGQTQPTVAFNGTYLVAWNDERDDSGTRVYGGRLDGAGNKQDGDGVLLTGMAAAAFSPVVTAGAGGNWAMAFSRGSSAGITIDLRTVAPK